MVISFPVLRMDFKSITGYNSIILLSATFLLYVSLNHFNYLFGTGIANEMRNESNKACSKVCIN